VTILTGPDDLDIAARTIWGEARGEPDAGKIAVMWVIRNRAEVGGWWGDTVKDVCLKKWQFSCWNSDDPNRAKIEALSKDSPDYRHCVAIAAQVLVGSHYDITHGATHYHSKDMSISPAWTTGPDGKPLEPLANIGNHLFFKTA